MDAQAQHHKQQRSYWLKTLHQWHWISSAACLVGMLLFGITGITLNHAAQIEAKPQVTQRRAELPAALAQQLAADKPTPKSALPAALQDWLRSQWKLETKDREAEWSADEIYLSLPRPGGDAWLRVSLPDGDIEYERTDRGWLSYFNDLHKGRNTGVAWSWFIDIFAVACLVFCITGLFILKMHAAQRALTWPLTALGLVLPVLLALLFIH